MCLLGRRDVLGLLCGAIRGVEHNNIIRYLLSYSKHTLFWLTNSVIVCRCGFSLQSQPTSSSRYQSYFCWYITIIYIKRKWIGIIIFTVYIIICVFFSKIFQKFFGILSIPVWGGKIGKEYNIIFSCLINTNLFLFILSYPQTIALHDTEQAQLTAARLLYKT